MNSTSLRDVDWETVFASDPGISVAILSTDGEIVFGSRSAFSIFGVAPDVEVEGKRIDELFHPEFVRERMEWIGRVVQQQRPLRVQHIYQGRSIVSTITPLGSPPNNPHVLIVSRLASPSDPSDDSPVEKVSSELIDLGPLESLSKRELEVLVLLGHGRSVPETAKILHRSPRTVERHKEEIGRKLGASTIAEIVKLVNILGLSLDDPALKRYRALRPEFANEN